MTSKMFLDIVGVITTSKLSILSTFQGGGSGSPPPCQVGLIPPTYLLSSRQDSAANCTIKLDLPMEKIFPLS